MKSTQYAERQARELKTKKGILAMPEKNSREGLSEEIHKLVIDFYEREDLSMLCPGKKDCIAVKMSDGKREKIQKRLL